MRTALPLYANNYYHIFNHAVGTDNLFLKMDNYDYFLKRYQEYFSPLIDTLAYVLMPNHFHFAIRVKEENELYSFFWKEGSRKARLSLVDFDSLSSLERADKLAVLLSQQFSNLFNSYTKSLNRQQDRKGNLFRRLFHKLHIDSDEYLRNIIHYIHINPVHHGFTDSMKKWKYSSYHAILKEGHSRICREEVLEIFGSKENFIFCHKQAADEKLAAILETN